MLDNILNVGFFRLARNVSLKSKYRIRVGCVLVLHGNPISVGFNYLKSHPRFTSLDSACIHAEISAIMSADTDLIGATAFIYRERKDGTLGLARPCNRCYRELWAVGVKRIYYSTYEGYAMEKL